MSIYRKNFPEKMTRNASLEDAAAVAAIYNKCVLESTATFETEPLSDEQMRARMAEIIGRGFPYIAGEIGGEFAGFAWRPPLEGTPRLRKNPRNNGVRGGKIPRTGSGRGVARRAYRKMRKTSGRPRARRLLNLRKPPERAPPRKIRVPASFGFSGGGLQIRQIPRGIRLRAVDSARIRPIKKC